MRTFKNATIGWVLLFGYIAIYDFFAIRSGTETLSAACYRGLDHKYVRFPVAGVMLILVKHLGFRKILSKYDPLLMVASAFTVKAILEDAEV